VGEPGLSHDYVHVSNIVLEELGVSEANISSSVSRAPTGMLNLYLLTSRGGPKADAGLDQFNSIITEQGRREGDGR
jgi:hypothetical protein